MANKHQRLIHSLVQKLDKQPRLSNRGFWTKINLWFLLSIWLVLEFFGIRWDYQAALVGGAMIWKFLLFFGFWLTAMLLLMNIARPNGILKLLSFLPFFLACCLLLGWLIQELEQLGRLETWVQEFKNSALECVLVIGTLGMVTLYINWHVWLKKTASPYPMVLGGLAGLMAGSMSAMVYSLHCVQDNLAYIIMFYGLPILLLTLLGGWLGRRYLVW